MLEVLEAFKEKTQGKSGDYMTERYNPSKGYTFFDCLRSIDCDGEDKVAECKRSHSATLLTKQVVDIPFRGGSAETFRIRIERLSAADRCIGIGIAPADTKRSVGCENVLGQREFPGGFGILCQGDRCCAKLDGSVVDSEVGGVFREGEVLGIVVEGSTVRLERNSTMLSLRYHTTGKYRFAVSLCGEGQRVCILRGTGSVEGDGDRLLRDIAALLEERRDSSEAGGLPVEQYEPKKGFRFLPDLKSVKVSGSTARCLTTRPSSLLTQQSILPSGRSEF
eukprot:RCo055044